MPYTGPMPVFVVSLKPADPLVVGTVPRQIIQWVMSMSTPVFEQLQEHGVLIYTKVIVVRGNFDYKVLRVDWDYLDVMMPTFEQLRKDFPHDYLIVDTRDVLGVLSFKRKLVGDHLLQWRQK